VPYYVVQVRTRTEKEYIQRAEPVTVSAESRLVWPRRALKIRKGGAWRETIAPIFPGYVFLEAEGIPVGLYQSMKKIPGFIRFLRNNQNITPLNKQDSDLLLHFLSFGETVDKSKVYFDVNNRICAVSGPLKGLEGKVVKVDRRKGRAKVKLDLCENSFLVDFGFEDIEKVPG
jgi:transcriptional antiterminator NusG